MCAIYTFYVHGHYFFLSLRSPGPGTAPADGRGALGNCPYQKERARHTRKDAYEGAHLLTGVGVLPASPPLNSVNALSQALVSASLLSLPVLVGDIGGRA